MLAWRLAADEPPEAESSGITSIPDGMVYDAVVVTTAFDTDTTADLVGMHDDGFALLVLLIVTVSSADETADVVSTVVVVLGQLWSSPLSEMTIMSAADNADDFSGGADGGVVLCLTTAGVGFAASTRSRLTVGVGAAGTNDATAELGAGVGRCCAGFAATRIGSNSGTGVLLGLLV